MSNPYRDKLLSLGIIGRRSRDQIREGREHPETGKAWKSVTNEAGTVTEHNVKGDRQDVVARPATVRMVIDRSSGKAVTDG
jgi:hypothetical protein